MGDDVLIRAEGVSRKFCRDLKRSLWYGVQDSLGDLVGRDSSAAPLRRDEFWAVDDVSFELKRGECLGLIGGNGAGKTTLLKMLNGLIKPDRGRIEMHGRVGALIALGAGFNPVLTGRENIYVNGAVLGLSRREIEAKYDEIVDFADIGDFIDAPVQSYSSGMQVRLGFSIAVAVRPQILLLDEVLAVGDANFHAKCLNTLASFREHGTSFLLVSHNPHMIARYCQSVLYLAHGRTKYLGEVAAGLAMLNRDSSVRKDEDPSQAPDYWSIARGSGKIRFTGAEFLSARNERTTTVDVGEPVTLRLEYERTDPTLSELKIDLSIRDGDEVIYQGDNLSSNYIIDNLRSIGTIFIHFKYIPMNVENLDFSFAFLNSRTGEVHDWKKDFRINVNRRPLNSGRVFVPSQWRIEEPAYETAPSIREGVVGARTAYKSFGEEV